jgi:hypothetical protein
MRHNFLRDAVAECLVSAGVACGIEKTLGWVRNTPHAAGEQNRYDLRKKTKEYLLSQREEIELLEKRQSLSKYYDTLRAYDDMVDVVHERCIICNDLRKTFNYKGLKAEYCSNCKLDNICFNFTLAMLIKFTY